MYCFDPRASFGLKSWASQFLALTQPGPQHNNIEVALRSNSTKPRNPKPLNPEPHQTQQAHGCSGAGQRKIPLDTWASTNGSGAGSINPFVRGSVKSSMRLLCVLCKDFLWDILLHWDPLKTSTLRRRSCGVALTLKTRETLNPPTPTPRPEPKTCTTPNPFCIRAVKFWPERRSSNSNPNPKP